MKGIGNIRKTKRSADSPKGTTVEVWAELLIQLGWRRYMGDDFHWKSATNRYVDIDLGEDTYIDVFAWDDGEKTNTYLTLSEISAFHMLALLLTAGKGDPAR